MNTTPASELCVTCAEPITKLRIVVPGVTGYEFGPYCSMGCAPQPVPQDERDTWQSTDEVRRLVDEYGLAGVLSTLVHLYDEQEVREAIDAATRPPAGTHPEPA